MNLLLKDLRWASDAGEGRGDIRIKGGRILEMRRGLRGLSGEQVLKLGDHVALPGLINAHDHLGLSLFSRRGHPPYSNFYGWARDVYRPDDDLRHEIMSLPLRDRLWWGAYRNLLAGVTTVAHHDPFARSVFGRQFPIQVLRRYGWAHSLGFGRHVKWKAGWSRLLRRPFMIHAAEGVDEVSSREVDRLDAMGLLAPHTVLIHAIALTRRQIDRIADAGCAVIWCPASNHYLFGASAPISALRRRGVPVALGTDSTLSGSMTLLHEIRDALESGSASADDLLAMVTAEAARILRVKDGRGTLCSGGRADISIFPDGSSTPAQALLEGWPAMVVVRGGVRLARQDLADRLALGTSTCTLMGSRTWIYGDVDGLMRRIASRVRIDSLERNPTWRLFTDTSSIRDREPHVVATP